jgi:hypothetical protein
MTNKQLRRVVAVGGSLAVMAVGGGYATGAFAHAGTPAHAQVRVSPAAGQHLGKASHRALQSRQLELGHAAAAAVDPAQSDDQGENADDQGDSDNQGENADDQGDSDNQGENSSGPSGDSGSSDTSGDDNGGDGNSQ